MATNTPPPPASIRTWCSNLLVNAACLEKPFTKSGRERLLGGQTLNPHPPPAHAVRKPLHLFESRNAVPCVELLLAHFKRGWSLEFVGVPPAPDMARSPLQPIFVRAQRVAEGTRPTNYCSIKRSPKAPNAEQLDDICQVRNCRIFV